jgi:N-acetylneuraminic acid mutarotase
VPTKTCCAVGPVWSEEVDAITGAAPWVMTYAAAMWNVRWVSIVALAGLGCGGGGADDGGVDGAVVDSDGGVGWTSAPAVLGGAIQETGAVAVDGRIYVIGGFDGSLAVVQAVRVFDTVTSTWSDGPRLPSAVHHANVATTGGTIYVLGAMAGPTFDAAGVVWSWNPATDAGWTERSPMPAGTERASSLVGVVDGVIYVIGGLRGGAVADVSAYDPSDGSWDTSLPPLPEPRDHGCGGVVAGTIYVAGGRRGAIGSTSDAVYAYTPGGAWQTRAPMPTGRGGTACGVIADQIIVVGGEGNAADPSGVFPQVEVYTPATDRWESRAPMPTPRHGMGAAAWGGRLYVPGGATRQAFGAVDTHEVLTP